MPAHKVPSRLNNGMPRTCAYAATQSAATAERPAAWISGGKSWIETLVATWLKPQIRHSAIVTVIASASSGRDCGECCKEVQSDFKGDCRRRRGRKSQRLKVPSARLRYEFGVSSFVWLNTSGASPGSCSHSQRDKRFPTKGSSNKNSTQRSLAAVRANTRDFDHRAFRHEARCAAGLF